MEKNKINKKIDCIIFDMDGTLWDAIDSYTEVWNQCSMKLGIDKRVTSNDLLHYMGKPLDVIFKDVFKDYPLKNNDEYLIQLAKTEDELMPKLGGNLYPHVKDGIIELSKKYPIMLVSNCGASGLLNFMNYTTLTPYVTDSITNGETRLNKAENIKLLLNRYNYSNGFYIGDTQHDCDETHKAGLKFGFMKYGFGNCNNADVEFDDFKELVNYFI